MLTVSDFIPTPGKWRYQIPTYEMQKRTDIHQFAPSHQALGQPAHQKRSHHAGAYKAEIDRGCLVVGIAKLDSAEKDHVADNAKESELFAQLHEQ